MKIGVATIDEITVCDHLARAVAFCVLEVDAGHIRSRTLRVRGTGECGNHQTFADLLAGCDVVLCGGIGAGAVTSLTARGIHPVVLAEPAAIDDAVQRYLEGTLKTTSERVCLCGPDHH